MANGLEVRAMLFQKRVVMAEQMKSQSLAPEKVVGMADIVRRVGRASAIAV